MKILAVLGSFAVAALIAIPAFTLQRSVHVASRTIIEGAEYACCLNFSALTKEASLVVQARVIAASPSYIQPNNVPQVIVADHRPQLAGLKATALAGLPTPTPGASTPTPDGSGLLLTDFTVEVVSTLRGTAVPGQRLTVTQVGGTDSQGGQVIVPDVPLFNVGETEVLFLYPYPDVASAKYTTVGGAQGRFTVNSAGILQALASNEFPYTRAFNGKTVNDLLTAAQTVQ